MDSVRFYFSFRSPYAWLAFHRINHLVEGCPVNFEYIPISSFDLQRLMDWPLPGRSHLIPNGSGHMRLISMPRRKA
jgi:hypothetical protein